MEIDEEIRREEAGGAAVDVCRFSTLILVEAA
jgi:hypothetical protein